MSSTFKKQQKSISDISETVKHLGCMRFATVEEVMRDLRIILALFSNSGKKLMHYSKRRKLTKSGLWRGYIQRFCYLKKAILP